MRKEQAPNQRHRRRRGRLKTARPCGAPGGGCKPRVRGKALRTVKLRQSPVLCGWVNIRKMPRVKVTQYFLFTRKRPDRRSILNRWLEQAMQDRTYEQVQGDGRIRRWTWIPEEGKYLRVILLEDGLTLHNAFFDRRFNPQAKP